MENENSKLRHPAFPAPRRAVTAPIAASSLQAQDRSSPASSSSAAAGQLGSASVETLYNHPSVKIVSFTAGNRPRSLSPRRSLAAAAEEQPGTLPSSSRLERTIAVGTFQIYRAPGSVAFLRCGSALQPILPKSQCWCIDEASSKFVLQIRRPNYWRIEVPVVDDEDVRRALLLREIFDRILQFEKTPCPFQRSFTVDLPEQPHTPVKKRPWTPVRKPPAPVQCPPTPVELTPKAKASMRFDTPEHERPQTAGSDAVSEDNIPTPRARLARDAELERVPEPEDEAPADELDTAAETDGGPPLHSQPISEETLPKVKEIVATYDEVSEQAAIRNEQDRRASSVEATEQMPQPVADRPLPVEPEVLPELPAAQVQEQEQEQDEAVVSHAQEVEDVFESSQPNSFEGSGLMRTRKGRITSFASRRAATAPPQLTLYTSPPSKSVAASKVPVIEETPEPAPTASNSPTDSSASFHSVQSWDSLAAPLPPSPPLSNPNSPTKFPYPHQNISRPSQQAAQRESGTSGLAAPQPAWDAASAGAPDGTQGSSTIAPSSSVSEDGMDLAPSGTRSSEDEYYTPLQDGDAPVEAATSSSSAAETSPTATTTSATLSRRSPYRTRATTSSISSHRALSPLPPAANLFTPRRQQQRRNVTAPAPAPAPAPAQPAATAMVTTARNRASAGLAAARRLPSAIINKTCEILLSPPSHIISLMLNVAARIAAGQWRGYLFGTDEGGERVDVRWDWSDTDDSTLEGWEDGDFDFDSTPVPLRRARAATVTAEDDDRAERRPPPVLRQRASLPVLNKAGTARTPRRRFPGAWQSPMEEAEDVSGSWGVD